MILKSTLDKAAQENILSPEQVEPLFQFLQNEHADDHSSTILAERRDEPLKFVRSFGDVFIALGVVLLVLAINVANLANYEYILPAIVFIGLAEWLVRVRKLVLPGMVILLSIIYFVYKAIPFDNGNGTFIGLSIICITSLLFYLRYKMPFSLFPFSVALVALFATFIGFDILENPIIFSGFGLIIFAVAFWFDSLDTKRVSHLSDNAFWLYLLASPLIVHGVMISLLLGDWQWIKSLNIEVVMMAFFIIFFLISLLIDRRVMLISTQMYMIYALSQVMQSKADNEQEVLIYVLVALSLFVIYFGAYWYKTRQIIFGFISSTFMNHYIPDLNKREDNKIKRH